MDSNRSPSHHQEQDQRQKTALVTGSSNGIGEAIVKQLAKLDYKLVVTGRNLDDIARVAQECARLSPSRSKPLEIVADLEREPDVDRLFELAMGHFEQRLDLLVNNAGLGLPVEHTKTEACYESFKRTIQVNLNSAVRLTLLSSGPLERTARDWCQGRPTSVINIGSLAAFRPTQSLAAYSVSKAALAMFTNCMACELAPLIRVNCINPGPVETKIIERAGFSLDMFKCASARVVPLQRIGHVDEVAEAALYLADSCRAGFITGAQLTIDGGALWSQLRWQD